MAPGRVQGGALAFDGSVVASCGRGRYPSDLSDEQWALIEPVITAEGPHRSVSGHQGAQDVRESVNAFLRQGRTGPESACLPHDLPPKSATYYYLGQPLPLAVLWAEFLILPFTLAQSGDQLHALTVGLLRALLSAALPYRRGAP